MRLIQTAD